MSATFKNYVKLMQAHINAWVNSGAMLYVVNAAPETVWFKYLDAFPEGTNRIFRERREHDCSCCRHFVKSFGDVVALKDGVITSIWDFEAPEPYGTVNKKMTEFIKNHYISSVYVPPKNYTRIGTAFDVELDDDTKTTRTWHHFCYDIPKNYRVAFNARFRVTADETANEIVGRVRDDMFVFKRSLEEISLDAIETVLELISSGSIYRGDEWKKNLEKFKELKMDYISHQQSSTEEGFLWEKSADVGPTIARIKNHSMGTLLMDITNGVDLDKAVKSWENMVAGPNYKRPKPIYTKKMLDDAKNALSAMGYLDSLRRRYAVLDDISVNDILFCDRDAAKRVKQADDIFDEMATSIPLNPKAFSRVEVVPIDTFISDILPTATSIELLLENRLSKNLMSLIAPQNPDAPSMFKWSNAFSWAYAGNITDSNIKENVKAAGGNVSGDLRFSIQWNDEDEWDRDDLDAHCIEPSGYEIYFGNRNHWSPSHGRLDVDIIDPSQGRAAVENIYYPHRDKMRTGEYHFFVHQYNNRGGTTGFRAEIEFDGQVHSFEKRGKIRDGEKIFVATVTRHANGTFSIKEHLPSSLSSRKVWGLQTQQFYPVSVVMNSPNFWENSSKIGNKHWFFMIDGLINDESPNGFYNEFLVQDLDKYRHVMEALGEKLSVVPADDQLSGVGFSSTIRNDVVLRVTSNNVTRVIKVAF